MTIILWLFFMIVKSETGAEHEQEQWGNIIELRTQMRRLSDRHLTTPTPKSDTNWSPISLWFGLWFNCYNLIIKYVPEKPLKDAFYNYHRADYTIESTMPEGGGGGGET